MAKSTLFDQIKEHADNLKGQFGQRNSLFDDIERAYFMEYNTRKAELNKNVTISPDARNAVRGMVQLIVATDPQFNLTDPANQSRIEKLEQGIDRAWQAAGRISNSPVHYDMITSAALYSEIHTAVTLTSELVAAASKSGDQAARIRAERLRARTPVLYSSWSPKTGYPEFDKFGELAAYYREVSMPGREIASMFGGAAKNLQPYRLYTLCQWWDNVNYAAWVGGELMRAPGPHELPQIPVVVSLTEGSRLFDKPEQNREPLLYPVVKGKWWDWQNAILTTVMTSVFSMGLTPLYAHTRSANTPDKDLDINFDTLPGVMELDSGERVDVLQTKGIIDPAVSQVLGLIEQKIEQSTIYRQALGAPLEGQQPFSTVALLSQSGRLPLVNTQKRGAWAIGALAELTLSLLKNAGETYESNGMKFVPADIPDAITADVRLDVKLPQDKLQLANIATMLKKANLVDDEWIQTEILGIAQPGEMQKRVWSQNAADMLYMDTLQRMIAQMQQQQQPPMAGQPGQMPTPDMQQPQPGMGAGPMPAGEAMQGGLPQTQAGLMPGQGEAAAPEGMM